MCNYDLKFGFLAHFQRTEPKGAVIVMVAVLLVVLLGCVALAVDIGYLYVARAELQRTADAAALAGAQALGRDVDQPFGEYLFAEDIYAQVESYALSNHVIRQGVVLNRKTDITIGYLADTHDRKAALQIVPLDQANAVQVIARRNSSSGGEIPLFFASIWGINSAGVGASAIAVLDDRFYAYAPTKLGGTPVIPFAVDEDVWNDQIVNRNGPDEYAYNSDTKDVLFSPDTNPEIRLFPEQLGPSPHGGQDDDEGAGAGNFGLLHIGSSQGTSGTSTIVRQITHGITGEDLADMTGEPMIRFYEQISGESVTYNAVSYDISGDPGIKAGVEDAMQAKIGQVVGFFLYRSVTEQGSNAVFDISGMRFGRVMQVELSGSVGKTTMKAIIIQPVPYYGPDIITSPHVPATDREIGRLELVR